MAVKVAKLESFAAIIFKFFLEASQLLKESRGRQATGRRHAVAVLRQANP